MTNFEKIKSMTEEEMADAFFMAKDIRDKYVLGRLMWDLGKM